MKIDAGFEDSLAKAGSWASEMEASGLFDGLWANDTNNDPFLLTATMLGGSKRALVGTNIAVAFARSPYCTAQTAYNLAQLSQGRFVLGLGTQVRAHITKRFDMRWPDKPVPALKEYVALLRHLFDCFQSSELPNFRGDHFSCTLSSPVFCPEKHDFSAPPVGFSAVGPIATRAAGEVADFVFLHPFTHLEYLHNVTMPALKQGMEKRSSDLATLNVVGSCFCLATDSEHFKASLKQVLGRLAFYASTPNYQPVLAALCLEDLHHELHQLSRQGKWEEMARTLPQDFVEACTVMAPKSQLTEALRSRFADLYDRVVVDPRQFL